jgi:hypothetical protein
MKRRTVLTGLGTLAGAGGIAGTGAFTSVSAKRGVTVAVAGDDSALLTIDGCDGPNGDYVTGAGSGTATLDISPSNDDVGAGVNPDAVTVIDNALRLTNQGTQQVGVWLDVEPVEKDDGTDRVEFYRGDNRDTEIIGQSNAKCLGVGAELCIGLRIDTTGLEVGDDLFESESGDPGMVVNADAEVACDAPSGGPTLDRVWANDVDEDETSLGSENDGSPLSGSRSDPSSALSSPDGDFVSLGFGGELVVEFTGANGPLVPNSNEPDIVVKEVTGGRSSYPEEEASIEADVRTPNDGWQSLGTASSELVGGTATFDFGGSVEEVEAVRITDVSDETQFDSNADGYDVDAVGGWVDGT